MAEVARPEEPKLPDSVWVWTMPHGQLQVSDKRPDHRPDAVEYKRHD